MESSAKLADCPVCGVRFEKRCRTSKTCGPECGRVLQRKQLRKRPESITCQNCGKKHEPKTTDRLKYCSRECAFADSKAWYNRAPFGSEFHKAFLEWANAPVLGVVRECDVCSGPVYRYSSRQGVTAKRCSEECADEASRMRSRCVGEATKYGGIKSVAYKCKECGEVFQPPYGDRRRTFCSPRCQCRYHRREMRRRNGNPTNHRKRARHHGVPHEPIKIIEIYNRDKWVCQLCGKRVSKSAKYPDEDSPTIDHIIPMSRGGGHIKTNVQLAHWSCNVLKGDDESMNPAYQQLLLIG